MIFRNFLTNRVNLTNKKRGNIITENINFGKYRLIYIRTFLYDSSKSI